MSEIADITSTYTVVVVAVNAHRFFLRYPDLWSHIRQFLTMKDQYVFWQPCFPAWYGWKAVCRLCYIRRSRPNNVHYHPIDCIRREPEKYLVDPSACDLDRGFLFKENLYAEYSNLDFGRLFHNDQCVCKSGCYECFKAFDKMHKKKNLEELSVMVNRARRVYRGEMANIVVVGSTAKLGVQVTGKGVKRNPKKTKRLDTVSRTKKSKIESGQ